VFFPFEWHVKAKPYHPFRGNNPVGVPKRNILWTSVFDSASMKELNPDYILFSSSMSEKINNPLTKSEKKLVSFINQGYKKILEHKQLVCYMKNE
jgi:hypothetical protein